MRQLLRYLILSAVVLFLAVFLIGPVYTVVEVGLDRELLCEVFSNYIYLEGMCNSFAIAAVTTLFVFLIALPLALLYDRYEFPGKSWSNLLVMLPMILPPFVGALGFQQILGHYGVINTLLAHCGIGPVDFLGGNGRFWSVCLIEALHLYPILYLNLVTALGNLDPALDEAARNLGAGRFRRFRQITLPLMKPGILAGGSLVLAAFRLIVGLFLSFFVLMHKERMIGATKKLLAAILPRRVFNGVISVTRLTDNTFGKFFIGNLFDSLIVGILSFIVFWITGMPYYPLLSVIVGVTNVVPYFGPIIGAIPCIMLGLTDSLPRAFWLGVIILIIQQIDGNIISPKILGDATGLSSLWVVVAITVMGSFFGFVGMVIGVPLFSVVYTLIKNVTERRLKKKNMPTETAAYRHGSSPIPLVSPYEAFSDAYIQAEEDFESIRRQEEAPEDSTDGQASDQDGSADSNADTKETADTEEDMASAGADDEEKACPEQNQTDENSPEEQDSEMPGQIDIFALPEEENERDTSQSSAPDAPPDTPVSGTEEAPLSGEKSTPVSVEEAPPASTGADPDRSDDAPAAEGYDEDDSMPTGTAQTVLVSLTDDRKPQTLPSGKKKGRSHFRNNRKKSNDRGGKGGKRS